MHKETDTKERVEEQGFDIDSLIGAHALNGRNSGAVKHYYSNAQHACIASYLAEDIYDEGIARAMIAMICAERYTGYVAADMLEMFPLLRKAHEKVQKRIFEAFGLDPKLAKSEEVDHIMRMMLAIEHRDVRTDSKTVPVNLPEPPAEVEIAHMTARRARTALTLRVKELFPDLAYDHESALRESVTPHIIMMSEDRQQSF